MFIERSCGIDADDLFDPEILKRLEIGPMVDKVRKDMMCPVLTVSGYECDGSRRENKDRAKFSCPFPFFEIIEDAFALQKDYAGYDTQRFHLILHEAPVIDDPYIRFIYVCQNAR